ncbi:uncharacterized protein PAN0_010c3928 [Moesziomyces antarcticus]|uniref:Uncharacterized protein n=1 Tax=Pseudozyma antarctica TaxID=84753 RepID=A0A081CGB2_PSEA2|nr:uncharacterized protein PAN0_010c3928 [Moesziomyces antarcticus]GAK65708.1 hypothetical protein PAN0_010c3928 [Moesziomyces antarcticus]
MITRPLRDLETVSAFRTETSVVQRGRRREAVGVFAGRKALPHLCTNLAEVHPFKPTLRGTVCAVLEDDDPALCPVSAIGEVRTGCRPRVSTTTESKAASEDRLTTALASPVNRTHVDGVATSVGKCTRAANGLDSSQIDPMHLNENSEAGHTRVRAPAAANRA